ncbi:DUF4920 domain-containing protein [Gillisia sp. Q332]|uniref:DUF4920 domain-containing protein n=1 Tax=Gillisia xinjiangensis TaxID=3384765 RepID=UPI00391D0C36
MRNIWIFTIFCTLLFSSCKNVNPEETSAENEQVLAYDSFGEQISAQNALSPEEMMAKYKNLKPGDTLELSFEGKVNTVCKSKGCWMELDLPEEENVMVKFRDYGFFVPKDIEEQKVVIHGKAFVAEVSVEEQRHYAEDNGKSEAEITVPKRTLSFLADGVLIKKTE